MGVNPSNGRIYVVSGGNVEVLDSTVSSVSPIATIAVGTDPKGVALNATTNKIYVANSGSNDISVIDGSTSSVVATITDPNAIAPVGVAVNPSTVNVIQSGRCGG